MAAITLLSVGITLLSVGLAPPRPATRAGSVRMLTDCDRSTWCRDVEGADGLAVVYFFAPWCRNCKAVKPRLERLEREFSCLLYTSDAADE